MQKSVWYQIDIIHFALLFCFCSAKGSKASNGMHQLTSIKPEAPAPHRANTADTPGGDQADSSGDELPTLEKTAPRRQRSTDRYSNLPRRQTSYRIAKNLDAVSRKAMMMWEMSEVYSEQTSNRKKKVSRVVCVTESAGRFLPCTVVIVAGSVFLLLTVNFSQLASFHCAQWLVVIAGQCVLLFPLRMHV